MITVPAFEELTEEQQAYLLELIELHESGKYASQMFYLASLGEPSRLQLRPKERGSGVKTIAAVGVSRTDLQVLAEEGYITVTQPGNTPLIALKQKAFREAEDSRGGSGSNPELSDERLTIGGRIFIGHGRSSVWMQLRDFLERTLGLQTDEFNGESTAGISTVERLDQMLKDSGFAFLLMTGEDFDADGSLRARENVVHEAGLFQGRLGFRRAIILLEDGCNVFSNIHGLTVIRFRKGDISAAFEKIRQVLKREGLIE